MTDQPHASEPDGYCPTCETVPCSKTARPKGGTSRTQEQQNRIELKLNRILRHLGIDPDQGATDAQS